VKKVNKICLAVVVVMMMGCATGRSPVSPGLILTSVSGSESVGPGTGSSKKGESCATNILGLFAFGDASIHKATLKPGITKIQSVDYTTTSFIGIFANSCTIVYGE